MKIAEERHAGLSRRADFRSSPTSAISIATMDNYTTRLIELNDCIRDLEDALRHQRVLTAAAEMRYRALKRGKGSRGARRCRAVAHRTRRSRRASSHANRSTRTHEVRAGHDHPSGVEAPPHDVYEKYIEARTCNTHEDSLSRRRPPMHARGDPPGWVRSCFSGFRCCV